MFRERYLSVTGTLHICSIKRSPMKRSPNDCNVGTFEERLEEVYI